MKSEALAPVSARDPRATISDFVPVVVRLGLMLIACVSSYAQLPTPSTKSSNEVQSSPSQIAAEKKSPDIKEAEKNPIPDHEDWTKLSIQGLGLQQWDAMPGGTVERPQFTREMVRLDWRPDDPVDLYISLPKGIKKPRVILYLYGYPSDASRFTADDWCAGATQGGFAAVGFVSALTDERYRHRALKEWFVSELQESLATTTHDVQMILNYLETRSDLNTDRIGMYAQGSGASIAILAASADSRISVVDLLNPWGDWPDWLKKTDWIDESERPKYLRPEFLEKVSALDPVQVLPTLKQTVRLQQVKDDRITPTVARERIASAAPRGATVFETDNWPAYWKAWKEKKLWDWAKEKLEPKPAQEAELAGTGK